MTIDLSNSEMHRHLRQATKQAHHVLDHHPLLAPLLKPDMTVAQYGNALAALHGFQRRAETQILAFLDKHPGLFDYRSRLKVWALDEDLAVLGRSPMATAKDFPTPRSMADLKGILYVIEGSTQGGLMIARLLQALPIAPLPTTYFRVYGETATQKWTEFLRFADAHNTANDMDLAATAAASTFDAIRCHMDECLGQLEPVCCPGD